MPPSGLLLSFVCVLMVLVAPRAAETAVIYTYEGHVMTDLTFLQPKVAPFDAGDQVTGWAVFPEAIPNPIDPGPISAPSNLPSDCVGLLGE